MEVNTETAQAAESNIPANAEGIAAAAVVTDPPAATTDASAAANANAAPAPFTPNYKFKSGEVEGEVDEFLRPIIKDADTEAKIKDLYTKAFGLDKVKTRLTGEVESWKGKATEVTEKYGKLSESLSALSHHINRGDFDSFFGALKIPEAKVYQWLQKKLQEQDMTPEQRSDLQRQREEGNKLYLLERQNQELMQRQEQFQAQQNQVMLDQTLSSPEIASIAQDFDARVGVPGTFRQEVIKRGITLYHLHGRDPHEVVADLMGTIGKVFTPAAGATGLQANTQAAVPQKPPVIPNVQGKSSSPVKTAPKSIKELREKAALL
jgi:hypothetical protein